MKRNYPEHELQSSCVRYFDLSYPKLKQLFFHIPNERKTTPQAGSRLRSIGQRAGISDMMLAVPKIDFDFEEIICGLFIEFKAPGTTRQTTEQKNFQIEVEQQGYLYVLINDFDRFREVIDKYLQHEK